MTCKDCIHYEVCLLNATPALDFEGCLLFKDKSKIIELPCKVGDKVYINPYGIEVVSAEVTALTIALRNTIAKVITGRGAVFEYHIAHFGKTVFLTREEAERALEEMQ